MYIVPMDIPKHCNNCPFGRCNYNFPFGSSSFSDIDGRKNKTGTYGYVCNVDLRKNGRYTKVLRADCGKDIKKPKWCGLKEVNNHLYKEETGK